MAEIEHGIFYSPDQLFVEPVVNLATGAIGGNTVQLGTVNILHSCSCFHVAYKYCCLREQVMNQLFFCR